MTPAVTSAIEALTELALGWCRSHPIDQSVPRKTCADLAIYIAQVGHDMLKDITDAFDDHTKYPERPMIQISGSNEGEPTVWILGWRAGELTPIHDHEDSEAGIHVFEGAVTEYIYVPRLAIKQPGDESDYRMVQRELLQGSTVRVTSPYVHVFAKTCIGHDCIHATTIHCYYPRLLTMNFFDLSEDGEKLRYQGLWKDEG